MQGHARRATVTALGQEILGTAGQCAWIQWRAGVGQRIVMQCTGDQVPQLIRGREGRPEQPALPWPRLVDQRGLVGFGLALLDEDQNGLSPTRFPIFLVGRSEEHTSELQSLMRISYAVFCL